MFTHGLFPTVSVNPSKTEYHLIGKYQLHSESWLPNPQRITFKIGLLTFKALAHKEPTYLCDLLVPYNPTCQLRLSDQHLLTLPNIKSALSRRYFSFSAPSVWNSLPLSLRSCDSVSFFRKLL